MNKVTITVSDKERKNTTYTKISNSLLKYNLINTSRIIFNIKDLYNAPEEKEQWNRIMKQLSELVFNLMYAKSLAENDMRIIYDIPIIELRYKKDKFCMMY